MITNTMPHIDMKIEPIDAPAKSKQFIKGFKSAVLMKKFKYHTVYMQYLKGDEVDTFYDVVKGNHKNGYYILFEDDKYLIEISPDVKYYYNKLYCDIIINYKDAEYTSDILMNECKVICTSTTELDSSTVIKNKRYKCFIYDDGFINKPSQTDGFRYVVIVSVRKPISSSTFNYMNNIMFDEHFKIEINE